MLFSRKPDSGYTLCATHVVGLSKGAVRNGQKKLMVISGLLRVTLGFTTFMVFVSGAWLCVTRKTDGMLYQEAMRVPL